MQSMLCHAVVMPLLCCDAHRYERSKDLEKGLAWPVTSKVNSHQESLRERSVSVPLLSMRSRRHHAASPDDGLICGRCR